jgi:hypothetical protein
MAGRESELKVEKVLFPGANTTHEQWAFIFNKFFFGILPFLFLFRRLGLESHSLMRLPHTDQRNPPLDYCTCVFCFQRFG